MAGLLRRLRRQDGISLVMSIGVLAVLSLSGATLVFHSSANGRSASYSKGNENAFVFAEAGVNEMLAVLSNPDNDVRDPNLLSETTTLYDGGSVTWSGALDVASSKWTLTSTGRVKNPTGPGANEVRRTLSAKVAIIPTAGQPNGSFAWDYLYAMQTGNECDMTLANAVNLSSRLYVRGNLCLTNTAVIGQGPVIARGNLTLVKTDNRVGSSTSPINEAHIGGGCKYANQHRHPDASHSSHAFCSSIDNVYASILDQSAPDIAAPVPDWDYWYQHASPGPNAPCYGPYSSGTTPTFESVNDTTRNNSVTTVWNLTPTASYECWTDKGRLKWDAATRVLTVMGTMFIDGSASVTNAQVNSYSGQATLYLSGTFLVKGNPTRLCGRVNSNGTDCDWAGWDPNASMLTIVANGSGGQVPAGTGADVTASGGYQGAIYATTTVNLGTNAVWQGPSFGSTINIEQSVTIHVFPNVTTVPAGVPGATVVAWQPGPVYMFNG